MLTKTAEAAMIDHRIDWSVVQNDLAALKQQVEKLVIEEDVHCHGPNRFMQEVGTTI